MNALPVLSFVFPQKLKLERLDDRGDELSIMSAMMHISKYMWDMFYLFLKFSIISLYFDFLLRLCTNEQWLAYQQWYMYHSWRNHAVYNLLNDSNLTINPSAWSDGHCPHAARSHSFVYISTSQGANVIRLLRACS